MKHRSTINLPYQEREGGGDAQLCPFPLKPVLRFKLLEGNVEFSNI